MPSRSSPSRSSPFVSPDVSSLLGVLFVAVLMTGAACRKDLTYPDGGPPQPIETGGSSGAGSGGSGVAGTGGSSSTGGTSGTGGSGGAGTGGSSPDVAPPPPDAPVTPDMSVDLAPDAPACGGPGQACCPGNRCNEGGCCELGMCTRQFTNCSRQEGASCYNASCGGCGLVGQDCCSKNDRPGCTAPETTCGAGNKCTSCGRLAQACCSDGWCATGLACTTNTCVAGPVGADH